MRKKRDVLYKPQWLLAAFFVLLYCCLASADEFTNEKQVPEEYTYKNIVAERLFQSALNEATITFLKEDYINSLTLINTLKTNPIFGMLTGKAKSRVLVLEVLANTKLSQFSQALKALESLADLNENISDIFIKVRDTLQRRVFANISFNPKNGSLRESDADDFITVIELNGLRELIDDSELGKIIESMDNKSFVMTSDAEDWAEMNAVYFSSRSHPDVAYRLRELIVARIKARNFELPVKFLLHKEASEFLNEHIDNSSITLGNMLNDAIILPAKPETPTTTIEGFQIGKKLLSIFKQLKQ